MAMGYCKERHRRVDAVVSATWISISPRKATAETSHINPNQREPHASAQSPKTPPRHALSIGYRPMLQPGFARIVLGDLRQIASAQRPQAVAR